MTATAVEGGRIQAPGSDRDDRLHRVERALGAVVFVILFVALVAVGFVPPGVVVLSLPFLYVLARKPVLRRLAIRNASRRPRESALILLGALLGTAIITGSATVGDTLAASIRQGAHTQLGPIDEFVRSVGIDSAAPLLAAVQAAPKADIDGILPMRSVGASVATAGASADRKAEPHAAVVEVDFAAAKDFGGDAKATGIEGSTPAPGHAAIGKDLADTLGAGPGDKIDVFLYGTTQTFVVDAVLPRRGVAGIGFGGQSPNVFVTPGTIAAVYRSHPAVGSEPSSTVAVSNKGGVIDGAKRSHVVGTALEQALATAGVAGQVDLAKRDLLEAADRGGKGFATLFRSLGTFSALAGIILLVSIFIMLAEERKTELGMLRAVGLRRGGLVGSFSLEGWMYSVAAAALGAIAGLGVGRAIVLVTSGIFARGGDRFGPELHYTATRASIQQGFMTGFVISLFTVLATSWWISRLNVIRAVRDLPEPTEKVRSVPYRVARGGLGLFFLAFGVLGTLGAIKRGVPAQLLIAPAQACLGAAILLRRRLNAVVVDTVAAAGAVLWASFCFDVFKDIFNRPNISLFVIDGVVLTIGGVVLVSRHQSLIGHAVRRVGGGAKNMSLRLGLAYPLAKRMRTGLILATFTLVTFTLVSMTLFSGVFGNQIEGFTKDIAGGFDGQAFSNSTNPAPVDEIRKVPGVRDVAALTTAGAQFNLPAKDKPGAEPAYRFDFVAGLDATFVDGGPPKLGKRAPEFATESDAWRAVLADPTLIIVSEGFLAERNGPPTATVKVGDKVVLRDPDTGALHELRVAALSGGGFGAGGGAPAYMGAEAVKSMLGARAVTNLVRFSVDPGVDPQDVADRLNGRFIANGLDASSFRKQVANGLAQQNSFLRLMQGYLSLGLVVSVAGIGVVMVRAVRERRRDVGVLRSIGFEAKQVRRAFMAESSFVALEGLLLGTSLAVISTWRLLTSGAFGEGLHFTLPFGQLAIIVGAAFLATLAATISPAQQAAKIRPAVALRIAD
jgi:putative ABC transport system permease protein